MVKDNHRNIVLYRPEISFYGEPHSFLVRTREQSPQVQEEEEAEKGGEEEDEEGEEEDEEQEEEEEGKEKGTIYSFYLTRLCQMKSVLGER